MRLQHHQQLNRRAASTSTRAGFSLVELMIGFVVLVVAILGAMGSLTSSAMLADSNREGTIAMNAAQEALEMLHSEEFWLVFALYNEDDSDDPGGAPGSNFAVAGLDPQAGDADGFVGRILFPASGTDGGELRENLDDPTWGMPRDLSGDGTVDTKNTDYAETYKLLPVRVRIEWSGASGNRNIELETLLTLRRG